MNNKQEMTMRLNAIANVVNMTKLAKIIDINSTRLSEMKAGKYDAITDRNFERVKVVVDKLYETYLEILEMV